MAKTRRKYKGNATTATISAGLSAGAVSAVISSTTGWPTSGPFYCVVSPGTSSEEKILVGSISGTTISSLTRGRDDTSDQTHAAGCTIYPVFTAIDADEANELTSTYANQGGIVYQGASTFTQLAIGTAGQVMKVNSGATAPEWGQVGTAGIANDAITADKIASAEVGISELATAVVNRLVPVGTIAMYGGATAPTGWLLCDGTSTTGYTALAALVGSTTPDLRGRFAIGDNSTLTLLGTGGSATIAETNLPSHTHTFSATSSGQSQSHSHSVSLSDPGHSHGITDPSHSHISTATGYELGSSNWNPTGAGTNWGYDVSTGAATTGITVNSASTGISVSSVGNASQDHTHSVSGTTGNGSGSGTAYYPPYLVVNYIIKHD